MLVAGATGLVMGQHQYHRPPDVSHIRLIAKVRGSSIFPFLSDFVIAIKTDLIANCN
jgi:hypothetical protein